MCERSGFSIDWKVEVLKIELVELERLNALIVLESLKGFEVNSGQCGVLHAYYLAFRYVCIYIYIYTHTRTHTHTQRHRYIYIYIYVCVCVYIYIYMDVFGIFNRVCGKRRQNNLKPRQHPA